MTISTTGYKALVCLFMKGGNDSNNTLIPIDATGYAQYAAGRGAMTLAQSVPLPLNGTEPGGRTLGIHPSMPKTQALWNANKAAIILNCGTLIQPTTAAQAKASIAGTGSTPLPYQLFSHVDQQRAWNTSLPQNTTTVGWGGRTCDAILAQGLNPNLSFGIDIGGAQTYWPFGQTTNAYTLGTNPPTNFQMLNDPNASSAFTAMYTLAAGDSNALIQQVALIQQSTVSKFNLVNTSLASVGQFTTVTWANDAIQPYIAQVARLIKAQSLIGDARQLFYVELNGFDTHDAELTTQASQLAMIDGAISNFLAAMAEINMTNNVVLFTNSDFSRTLQPNDDGTDHAWGGHHFVFGGGVTPGYYGTFPNLTLSGPNDVDINGRWCPAISTDQMAATNLKWLGADQTSQLALLPNLVNFAPYTLGYF